MNEELTREVLDRLDVVAEKIEVAGGVLFQQAICANYAIAACELLGVITCITLLIICLKIIREKDAFETGDCSEVQPRTIIAIVGGVIIGIMTIPMLFHTLPDAIIRFAAPTLGAIRTIMGMF